MKIIRHGKNYKVKEKRRLKCDNCHCIFIATKDDIYAGHNIFNDSIYLVKCPDCKEPTFYQRKCD